jgi:hypothetical protein
MRNGQPNNNNPDNRQANSNPTANQTHNNTRGNWRKPGMNTRGGPSMRGKTSLTAFSHFLGRGRGGYGYAAPPGAVVYYPPPVEGESLKTALLFQVYENRFY